jgi:AIPR protein
VFNELYFKEITAKAIIFRFLDRSLMKQSWYGGYKANIITYSIAKFSELITITGKRLDLLLIWKKQQLTEMTQKHLLGIARTVNDCIQETPEGITNVTEWCKKTHCWINVQKIDYVLDHEMLSELIDTSQLLSKQEGIKTVQQINNCIEA